MGASRATILRTAAAVSDAVFITRNGTWHYPTNVRGRLWHLRHLDDHAAMNQLGHTSTMVTERHCIDRELGVPDYPGGRQAPCR